MEYYLHILILICIYAILAQSLNLCFGLAKLFNLAHIASYGIGAYTTALLLTKHNYSFISCIIFSGIISAVFSLLIGLIAKKLSNDYLAIGTLAFNFIVVACMINWKSLTHGVLGIPGIPRPAIRLLNQNIDFNNNLYFLYLAALIAAFLLLILWFLFRNDFSRKLRAQGEYEQAAQSLGIATSFNRSSSIVISSAFAGIAGGIYASYLSYIDPSAFSLTEMTFVLSIVVIGKPGSFWGALAATCFLVILPEPLRMIDLPPGVLGPLRQLIYALILFLVVLVNRRKLFPQARKV